MGKYYKPGDKLSIKDWAEVRVVEIKEQINYYIGQGVEKKQAVDLALSESTLGAGYNAQIRYDYR